jgi:mono/diheme cytochrome c family protein
LNPFLLLSAMILFAFSPAPISAPAAQDAAPAPAAVVGTAKTHTKINADTLAKAKKLYAVDCAMCHGDNGNGQTDLAKDMGLKLSDWSDAKTLAGKTDEELFAFIRKGKDKMPSEDPNRAKDDEVWNLVAFIRSMPNMPKEAPPAPDATPDATPAPPSK